MAKLAVNVDHIATLRENRKTNYPDPVAAAIIAELAGADGIVIHLRADRRHINERDVRLIRQVVQTKLILEMASTPEMVGIATDIRPDLITLVPEKREELTTEGGLDLLIYQDSIAQTIAILHENKIPVSIFIDPDLEQIKIAHRIKADMIEIHTGAFCDANTPEKKQSSMSKIVNTAKLAYKLKLGVNAGHGICYNTIRDFTGINEIDEFSIGHSIVARATLVGMEKAVREMKELISKL